MPTMGLRERKKEQTRQAIADAAFKLFAERGFAATTVADIAEAADIAPRTFFAYFPSKEDVVFFDFDQRFEALAERLRGRAPDQDTFAALRAWIADGLEAGEIGDDPEAVRNRLVCENDALSSHERHLMGRFEELIAETVADDLGASTDDLRPRLVAAATIAALLSLKSEEPETTKAFRPEALAQLDEAFAFLRGGISALRQAPAPDPR
jgi:TetR/AcrR family transcriptional regulator, regulator of mycofactocin system